MTELRLYSLVSYNLRNVVTDSVRDTREKLSACRVNNRLRGRHMKKVAVLLGRGISFMKF